MTGFGARTPLFPHHRPSEADTVVAPVPGMLVGGPNPGQQDKCAGYPSKLPARSYVDATCSYASNEIAINWNAPLAYLAAAVDATYGTRGGEWGGRRSEVGGRTLVSDVGGRPFTRAFGAAPHARGVAIDVSDGCQTSDVRIGVTQARQGGQDCRRRPAPWSLFPPRPISDV